MASQIDSDDNSCLLMHFEENRLATFSEWPFERACNCTPAKMAEAGFFHIGKDNEPDLVRCFVCLKELDGWEPTDFPWKEHRAHSPNCPLLKLKNPIKMTVEQLLKLEFARQTNIMEKATYNVTAKFEKYAEETRNELKNVLK